MNISDTLQIGVVLLPLSASSMALFFSILFYRVFSMSLFLLVFLLTYAVYGMDRLASVEEDRLSHPERTLLLQRIKWPFAGSILLAFSGALLLATSSGWVVILIPVAPIVVMLYSGNLSQKLLGTRKPNLKQHFIVKDIAIASGWAFLLPLASLYLGRQIVAAQWLFLTPLLIKLFVMAVAYDFKDINSDLRAGVQTLPVVMGEDSSKLVLHILNAAATVLILLLIYFSLLPLLGVVFVPAFIYQFLIIHIVQRDAPGWVYFVVCDLEQFFWLLFLGIGGWVIGYY